MGKVWSDCRNILCIRLDNMGDLLMSSPAIRALKESFGCRITVLTTSMGSGIARFIPCIDDVIVFNAPWTKIDEDANQSEFFSLIDTLKKRNFDGAVVFSVFSQNPIPAVMAAYLAKIPLRLAYCRENPYQLLTDWIPDEEPYTFIRHQVKRDLDLVASVGAIITDKRLNISIPVSAYASSVSILKTAGVEINKPWIIVHAGVSEAKRKFPEERFISVIKKIRSHCKVQILLTGTVSEKALTDHLAIRSGSGVYSLAGLFKLEEFIALIEQSPLVISVNTGTIHIAAAVDTPVIVLYAQTNPQHTPWMVPHYIFPFDVPENLQSKNEVLQYLQKNVMTKTEKFPTTEDIVNAAHSILDGRKIKPGNIAYSFLQTNPEYLSE